MGDGIKRLLFCTVLIAAIAGGTVATRLTSNVVGTVPVPGKIAAAGASLVSANGVSSSGWYCASAQPASLIFSSTSSRTVVGTITWTGSRVAATTAVSVPPGAQVQVPPPAKAKGAQAETVILYGGSVAVGEVYTGSSGWSASQCASSTSPTWYFPQGSTLSGDSLTLEIYDPSATPAVVDVDLLTSSGEAQPSAYQGIAVAPGQVVSETLDAHATQDAEVGTVVQTVSGSVVAEELTTFTAGGVNGFVSQLGTPKGQQSWSFPYCDARSGTTLTFNVINPGTSPSTVVLKADDGSKIALAPDVISVPGNSTASIVLTQNRSFVAATPYSVVVRGSRDIVVGRTITNSTTVTSATGVPDGGRIWLVPSPPTAEKVAAMTIQALGSKPVLVRITRSLGDAPLAQGTNVVTLIKPNVPAVVSTTALALYQGPWVIKANGPVVVELDAAASPGMVEIPAYVLP